MSRLRRLRPLAGALAWTLALLIISLLANLVGIRLAGDVVGWQHWLSAHSGVFLGWRVLLYAGTAWGWLWMRRRLRAREPGGAAVGRLLRVEIAAVLVLLALEASLLLSASRSAV